jgi:hypothetical protein
MISEPDMSIPMELLGVGLIKISDLNAGGKINIIYQKGIGNQLIQKIININKEKILVSKQGFLIDIISNYTVYIHFFDNQHKEITVIIYLDKKKSILKFSKFYYLSKKLNEALCSKMSFSEIQQICKQDFEIPKSNSLLALLIIGTSGHLYFSKINTNNKKIANVELQISGFISALLTFTKELIGQGPGIRLKQINFGNQRIYLTLKNDVVFAYLVEKEKILKIDKRYMQLIPDEFITLFKDKVNPQTFNGDVSHFKKFERNNQNFNEKSELNNQQFAFRP